MNTEHLSTIAEQVIRDVNTASVIKPLNQLRDSLDQLANNPADQNAQTNFAQRRDAAIAALERLSNIPWNADIKQTISDHGGEILLDGVAKERVIEVVSSASFGPAPARDAIDNVRNEIEDYVSRLNTVSSALAALNITARKLAPGDTELGMLIPRELVSDRIDLLADEINGLDRTLKLLSQAVTGTREDIKLDFISSTDPKIYVKTSTAVVLALSTITSDISTVIYNSYQTREIIRQLDERRFGEDEVKKLIEKERKNMEGELKDVAKGASEEFGKGKTKAEKNANLKLFETVVKHLAPRLERGMEINIRIEQIPAPKPPEDGDENAEAEELTPEEKKLNAAAEIAASTPKLGINHTEILELPPPELIIEQAEADKPDGEEDEE